MQRKITHFEGSPLQKATQMAKDSQFAMGQYIKDLEAFDSDPVDEVSKIIKEHVTNSDSSRSVMYKELNPILSLHPIYHSCRSVQKIQSGHYQTQIKHT